MLRGLLVLKLLMRRNISEMVFIKVDKFVVNLFKHYMAQVYKGNPLESYIRLWDIVNMLVSDEKIDSVLRSRLGGDYVRVMENISGFHNFYLRVSILNMLTSQKARSMENWKSQIYQTYRATGSVAPIYFSDLIRVFYIAVSSTQLKDIVVPNYLLIKELPFSNRNKNPLGRENYFEGVNSRHFGSEDSEDSEVRDEE